MKTIYILALAVLLPLAGCSLIEERVMQAAVDNADKIAKFADLYCEEVDAAKRLELREKIKGLRGGKDFVIEC